MTYAPQTLKNLAAYWVAQGGVNLGIVGDTAHLAKGTSYHLGKDSLTSTAYSIRTARDKAGLTNAASAIDLGRLDGSLEKLWAFSLWFAKQCMAKKPGYHDVREVIFWLPSRNRVVGWSALAPGSLINDYGDLSHKTHTHISYFRDSEYRGKQDLFKAYPAFAPPPPEEDVILSAYLPGHVATVKPTSNVRNAPTLTATVLHVVGAAGEKWTLVGRVKGAVDPEGGSDQWYVRWAGGHWEYTAFSNVPVAPVAPALATPHAAALAAAEAAAKAAAAALATAKTELAAANLKITNAKTALA
jgi:hypothetical protein